MAAIVGHSTPAAGLAGRRLLGVALSVSPSLTLCCSLAVASSTCFCGSPHTSSSSSSTTFFLLWRTFETDAPSPALSSTFSFFRLSFHSATHSLALCVVLCVYWY